LPTKKKKRVNPGKKKRGALEGSPLILGSASLVGAFVGKKKKREKKASPPKERGRKKENPLR